MAVSRRSFLAALAAAFVAPDPERLLWVPGARLISVPAPRVFESGAAIMAYWRELERENITEARRAYDASHAAWLERVRRGEERVRVLG